MSEYRASRRIEFSDTDASGTVHFSRFFAFLETAEDEFLGTLGASFEGHDGRKMGWPKVSASCDYKNPVRYGDEIAIHLKVAGLSRRTVTYEFVIRRGEAEVATGRTVSVCCVVKPGGGYEAIPIPAKLAAKIRGDEDPGE